MITLKTQEEIAKMRVACQAVARILVELEKRVTPGMSTGDLDEYAEKRCKELGVKPAFKGYRGFPSTVCISVNDEVVHGIPNKRRVLQEGDIVGLDFGTIFEGWYGDSAKTVAVGKVSAQATQLMKVTQESLMKGIEQCHEGKRVSDIGHAVQNYVESFGYSVVREFVGHGIGRALHEEPSVPNFGTQGKGIPLKAGMVIAIEPMVNIGRPDVKVLSDGWTAVTRDRSLSAHFEHTIAITKGEPEILTVCPE